MSVPRIEVLVVGGGVIGVAIADELARRGIGTLLLERDELAAGASGGAAGLVGAPIEGPAAGPFFELALAAQELLRIELPQLARETGIDVGYRETGTVRVAEDEAEAEELRARITERRERGLDVRWVDRAELRATEPGFSDTLRGALLVGDHHQVTSPWLVRALASRALRRGAVIRQRLPVRRLLRADRKVIGARTDDGEIRARVVVLAAGPWTAALAPIPLSVGPVKGQLAYLRPEDPIVRRPVFTRDVYIVPKPDGRLVVGATEEDAGFDATPREEVSRALVARAAEILPAVHGLPLAGSWAGLRPAAPDRLPIIGSSREAPGLILASAHFRNGVFLSLITARIVAALVGGERSPTDIAAFSPERFVAERTA
jgi:glycine oxidase